MYKRQVGKVKIGGDNPISVQSMTNTITSDHKGTIKQIKQLEEAGADIVRVSCPDKESTKALKIITKETNVPIVADIHFHYKRAIESAVSGAKCLRINPGNIGSKDRVKEVIKAAKDYDCAIRIGVNAGSLEKRILEKYKEPCPDALIESAIHNIKILEENDLFNFKISVKSSDVFLTVKAYKKLSKVCNYPLHLGVTEAGDGEDGRIKSAVGIGSLLEDGIGDTIRVSLTEEPEHEIPVAKHLANRYAKIDQNKKSTKKIKLPYDPYFHTRRKTLSVHNIGGENVPRVFSDLSGRAGVY